MRPRAPNLKTVCSTEIPLRGGEYLGITLWDDGQIAFGLVAGGVQCELKEVAAFLVKFSATREALLAAEDARGQILPAPGEGADNVEIRRRTVRWADDPVTP